MKYRKTRFTLNEVKEMYHKEKYEYLEDNYINAKTKTLVKCPNGHLWKTTLISFKNWGIKCPKCVKEAHIKKMKDIFSEEGYTVIGEYIDNNTSVLVECPNNHRWKVMLKNFKQHNQRCPKCNGWNIEKVKKYAEENGYECLEKVYTSNRVSMQFKCLKCNEIFSASWNNFHNAGQRCLYCTGNKKWTIKRIIKRMKVIAPGYTLKTKTYKNSYTKMPFKCPNEKHPIFYVMWGGFNLNNRRCRKCWIEQITVHDEESLLNLSLYRIVVTRYTNENYKKYQHQINPHGLKRSGTEYHLDHIYTVIDGFNNKILPQIISNPTNLQMLTAYENNSKGGNSEVTKDELHKRYEQHKQSLLIKPLLSM